jgi:type IV pilus assembly protein PilW
MSRPQQHKLQQAGFSLIELMIAVTLGLLIMTALVSLFVNTSRTNQEMAKTNSQIENARFALNVLADDLMHGG